MADNLDQTHFRIRTDAGAADGTPTWAAAEDAPFYPGASNFRLRVGVENTGDATGAVPWALYVDKNGGGYNPVTTSSAYARSVDAGSDADETAIMVRQLGLQWWLSGASIDLDFAGARVYGGTQFTDFLSCSRASIGYAKNADGTLTQFGNDTLRITTNGLLVENERTNVVLWNRDLTNVLWIAVNITAAKDQTGPDGVSNSASSITATAGNGTILQTTVIASSARYQSAYVKRITGTGTVNMTMDNGSTWTAITVTSSWTLVTIPTQTIANPIVGFQIVTSGDAVAVDFVQNEDGIFASSPIPTTTTSATRAADVVTCIGSLDTNIAAETGSVVMDVKPNSNLAGGDHQGLLANTDNTNDILAIAGDGNNHNFYSYQSATSLNATLGNSQTFTNGAKVAQSRDGTGRSLVGGGGTVVSDAAHSGISGALLGSIGPTYFMRGYFRRLTVWNSRLANATLQALTAP